MDGAASELMWWLVAASAFVLTGLSLLLLPAAWRDMKRFAAPERGPARTLLAAYLLLAVSPYPANLLFLGPGHSISWSNMLLSTVLSVPLMLIAFAAVLGSSAAVARLPRPPGSWLAWPKLGPALLWFTPLWTILLTFGGAFVLERWPISAASVVGTWETVGDEDVRPDSQHRGHRLVLHTDGTLTREERGGRAAPERIQGHYTYDPATHDLYIKTPGFSLSGQVTPDPFTDFHLTLPIAEDSSLIKVSVTTAHPRPLSDMP